MKSSYALRYLRASGVGGFASDQSAVVGEDDAGDVAEHKHAELHVPDAVVGGGVLVDPNAGQSACDSV